MGQTLKLTAADGHSLGAYRADPAGKPKGALVVIQEIFGVNHHMRGMCDGFAKDGYACIAPALFDRVKPGIELGYAQPDIESGRDIRGKVTWEQVIADVRAALGAVKGNGKIGIIGYCWGGSVAWRGATQIDGFSAAVGYYGGPITPFLAEKPKCPVMLHFGDKDQSIPMTDVEKIRAAKHANVQIFVYSAGHGFNCDERGSYDAASTKIARERTLGFFRKNIG
ncbi:MAG: dienelactone hydrolase family protein [Proteobacteria bacterium]|nr:dienelactone hydrolase family protein [Pseudomonadota bacterium]